MGSEYIDRGATHEQTHHRLEAIVAAAMDAIISVDDHQRIICFNPAAEIMFGISAPEVMGQPVERFIPGRFRAVHSQHVRRFVQTGETSRRMGALGAISALRANGEEFPVEASISHARAGNEQIATVIMRDITERKANEDAQALLAREVDHRAKNILAIVSSLVSLTEAPTQAEYAESLAGRISAMSRAMSLLAHNRWSGTLLREVATDELGSYAEAEAFTLDGPDLRLSARAVQPIGMLLHELATNALKYGALSTNAGKVALSWSRRADDKVDLIWEESGGPPVTVPTIHGFGSSLIRQIVENQLCGQLDHHWDAAGYRLTITLPETVVQMLSDRPPTGPTGGHEREATMAEQAAELAPADEAGTLLIVEDEPILAMQMTRSLTEYGWSILGVAGSIEEANRLLSGRKRPDAAILDVDLAGMPVFPLARSLRRLGIPFLFCTGYEDLEYVQEFADYRSIRKPATVMQIVRGLRDVVRCARSRSPLPNAT